MEFENFEFENSDFEMSKLKNQKFVHSEFEHSEFVSSDLNIEIEWLPISDLLSFRIKGSRLSKQSFESVGQVLGPMSYNTYF